jgi:hypothetical protein
MLPTTGLHRTSKRRRRTYVIFLRFCYCPSSAGSCMGRRVTKARGVAALRAFIVSAAQKPSSFPSNRLPTVSGTALGRVKRVRSSPTSIWTIRCRYGPSGVMVRRQSSPTRNGSDSKGRKPLETCGGRHSLTKTPDCRRTAHILRKCRHNAG